MEEFSITFSLGSGSAKRLKKLLAANKPFGMRIGYGSKRYGYTGADIIMPPYYGKVLCQIPSGKLRVEIKDKEQQ